MSAVVTLGAQRDQVVQLVVSECAPKQYVANLKLGRAATVLASPAISFENLSMQGSVGFASHLDSRTPWPD